MQFPLKTLISVACLSLFGSGCATRYINAQGTQNPPPRVALQEYTHFQVEAVTLNPAYADSEANQKATAKISEITAAKLGNVTRAWNQRNGDETGRTLIVQPHIKDIKFINGTARFWAGAMAGSSAVLMEVTMTDAETGEVIAKPEFYQHANAYAGAWSIGGADNGMLERVVVLIENYMLENYSQPVGGLTGKPTN